MVKKVYPPPAPPAALDPRALAPLRLKRYLMAWRKAAPGTPLTRGASQQGVLPRTGTRSMTKTASAPANDEPGSTATADAGQAANVRSQNVDVTTERGPPSAEHIQRISFGMAFLPWLREHKFRYVDKTGAIADFLMHRDGMHNKSRAFFVRPALFGKSLMLSTATEMLRAGELPPGVTPWRNYVPVDIDKLFGGLAVHERLRRNDPTLGTLMRQARFVIQLGVSGAMTGDLMEGSIKDSLAGIAEQAFGPEVATTVRSQTTAGGALRALVMAVPPAVPVVVTVDGYAIPITSDIKRHRWEAAETGIDALRSLLTATKDPIVSSRIERCIVTGVARLWDPVFNRRANNFHDFTSDPLLCAAVDFTEQEIRTTFPTELQRLATSLGMDVDGAMKELDRHYSGYCYDGVTTCFNPSPVLAALSTGRLEMMGLDEANDSSWLGLHPREVLHELMGRLHDPVDVLAMGTSDFDIADMELWARCVNVIPMLLQVGILTVGPPDLPQNRMRRCVLPNLYARTSLTYVMKKAMPDVRADVIAAIADALPTRSPIKFDAKARRLLDEAIAAHARRRSTRPPV